MNRVAVARLARVALLIALEHREHSTSERAALWPQRRAVRHVRRHHRRATLGARAHVEFGGHGLDGFFLGELRIGSGVPTALRATLGGGFDDLDGGSGVAVSNVGASGAVWSVGIGRELNLSAGRQVLLSADLAIPTVDDDVIRRRVPVLELGVGFRARQLQSIGPLSRPSR